MNFEVTATRKRPGTFDEVAGQDFVVSTLKNSIETGRIAHAYLFSGPRGVGKTSSARILGKALNCEKGPTPSPCGVCSNCVEIQKGNSLDVIEIDGASNTSVNDIREIKDEVLFAPNSSRYKIYIIDEVHMLSNSAFNALLKTIEEPPPYIVFIFATTEIHKVPATIRSRCQQFIFRLFAPEVMAGLLSGLCRDMGISAEDDALFWIAKEATGSLRDAYTLFDQVVSFSEDMITLEKIREKLGLVGLDQMNSIAEQMVEENQAGILELADEILMNGVPVEQFINDLVEYFRNLLLIKAGVDRESVLGYKAERFFAPAVEAFSLSQLEQGLSMLLDVYRKIRYSVNTRFELELTLSRLAALKQFISTGDMLRQIKEMRSTGGSEVQSAKDASVMPKKTQEETVKTKEGLTRPVYPWEKDSATPSESEEAPAVHGTPPEEESSPEPEKKKPQENLSSEELKDRIIASLRKRKLALSSALEKAVGWSMDGDCLSIHVSNAYNANYIKRELSDISQALVIVAGKHLDISVIVEDESDTEMAEEKDEQLEIVKRVFRGEVIGG